MADDPSDLDRNRLSSRLGRYARVTGGIASTAAKTAARSLTGRKLTDQSLAKDLRAMLGGLRGPIMKVGQFAAMIPEILPPEFAAELAQLQSNAPPMGTAFVRRRMASELGPAWHSKFASFDLEPVAAASLGQVHRAVHIDGRSLACKLQYPDMESAVAADMAQLSTVLSLQRTFEASVDTREVEAELTERVREELDYVREAAHMRLFRLIMVDEPRVVVPEVIEDLSTRRLLTMTWLDGKPVRDFVGGSQEQRDHIATLLLRAWWIPLLRYGVVHGDPHLGNYSVRADGGLNLFDFGCVRILSAEFVESIIGLIKGLSRNDPVALNGLFRSWGFETATQEQGNMIADLMRMIYEPMLDDRVRPIAEGTAVGDYMRKFVEEKRRRFRAVGVVRPPREFVFHQRATVGLGAVIFQLGARLNFHRLFMDLADGFSREDLRERQSRAVAAARVPGAQA